MLFSRGFGSRRRHNSAHWEQGIFFAGAGKIIAGAGKIICTSREHCESCRNQPLGPDAHVAPAWLRGLLALYPRSRPPSGSGEGDFLFVCEFRPENIFPRPLSKRASPKRLCTERGALPRRFEE
jgi:hypothetical protein